MSKHSYSDQDKAAIYKVISERRDMRHFMSTPIASSLLTKLLQAAHHAPSVGLMQPWRFIRISDLQLRKQIHQQVNEERIKTAEAIGEYETTARMAEFMRLKVEGILDCGELLVVTLCNDREKHIFGRRTLPEMDMASVSCAIQNLWLAARAEGIGMGWVSLFDPKKLATLLSIPDGAKPIAILCLGYVNSFYKEPMLVGEGWAKEKPLSEMLMENGWDSK
jgi:5,6-dimethylbenzimidazole synthase